jgi:GNAT superfamily N-acetyltransferase
VTPSSAEFRLADAADPSSMELVEAMADEIDELYADRPGTVRSVSATPDEMAPPGGAFVLVVDGGEAVGCGGLKRLDAEACEIKRMYVRPEARGKGLSRKLLEALEERARELGYVKVRLDTGDRQPAAKWLYESAGYRPIPNYNGNTMARFWFEKDLQTFEGAPEGVGAVR